MPEMSPIIIEAPRPVSNLVTCSSVPLYWKLPDAMHQVLPPPQFPLIWNEKSLRAGPTAFKVYGIIIHISTLCICGMACWIVEVNSLVVAINHDSVPRDARGILASWN